MAISFDPGAAIAGAVADLVSGPQSGEDPADADFREASIGLVDALARGDQIDAFFELGKMVEATVEDALYESPQERQQRLQQERVEGQQELREEERLARQEQQKQADLAQARELHERLKDLALERGVDPGKFDRALGGFVSSNHADLEQQVDQVLDRLSQVQNPADRAMGIKEFWMGFLRDAEKDILAEGVSQEMVSEYLEAQQAQAGAFNRGLPAGTDPSNSVEIERTVRQKIEVDPAEMQLDGLSKTATKGISLEGVFYLKDDLSAGEEGPAMVVLSEDKPVEFDGVIHYSEERGGGYSRVRGLYAVPRDGKVLTAGIRPDEETLAA